MLFVTREEGRIRARLAPIETCAEQHPTHQCATTNPRESLTHTVSESSFLAAMMCNRLFVPCTMHSVLSPLHLDQSRKHAVDAPLSSVAVHPFLALPRCRWWSLRTQCICFTAC
jgi:hypothetical protein